MGYMSKSFYVQNIKTPYRMQYKGTSLLKLYWLITYIVIYCVSILSVLCTLKIGNILLINRGKGCLSNVEIIKNIMIKKCISYVS